MDIYTLQIRRVLEDLGKSIRVPTACWLFSDLYQLTDIEVRIRLSELQKEDLIRIDNGGWIKIV